MFSAIIILLKSMYLLQKSVGMNNSVPTSTSDHILMHSRESYDGISGSKKLEQSLNNCQVYTG